MHAVLLTLIALGGGADLASGRITQSNADLYNASAMGGGGYGYGYGYGNDGGSCGAGGCGSAGVNKGGHLGGWFGHMPQTCYSPRYGCYYGNNRYMNRYPAFHGTFYRRPYNYRNLFDYPWHAEMHEPTSMFSYNVQGENAAGGSVGDIPQPPPPTPSPGFEAAQRQRSQSDAAAVSAMRRAVPAGTYNRNVIQAGVR